MSVTLPAIFFGHGNPMNALLNNEYTEAWRRIGALTVRPKAILAMSHYPGTWKYAQPAFDFDYWAIDQMEHGNHEALLSLTNAQLDEVGNTELLPWFAMFGAIGNQPGELLTYQPTWHHGHAVMRFIPNKREAAGLPLESKDAPGISVREGRRLPVL
jgi:hypothetical protein